MHEHISSLLGEHPRLANIFLGPVTVHYREVSLYMYICMHAQMIECRVATVLALIVNRPLKMAS